MTQKSVDGVLVDLTPEEEAAYQQAQQTPKVQSDKYDIGPTIAEQLGEPVNVKS